MKLIWESGDNRIAKAIISEGNYTEKPTERSECRVRIYDINISDLSRGDGITDDLFPSEYLKSPTEEISLTIGNASFKIDEYIERIIQTMCIKEEITARITTPHPVESSVSNESEIISLELKIALISCEFSKPIWEWTVEEKYDVSSKYKEIGVSLYKSGRIPEAFYKFSRACKILITLEPMEDRVMEETLKRDVNDMRKVLYNNMAECHLIRKNYEEAILLCDKVLKRDENNVKALYRKSVANENLKDYETAAICMEKVVSLEPRNSAAIAKLDFYKKRVSEAKKSYDNIVKKMFHV